MEKLKPIELPLDCSVLIEASAGTGKTYTMANLYLRLILGVKCQPLNVEQILVVTFTKAATQELRDRIRAKLAKVAKWFEDIDNQILRKELDVDGDESQFLLKLYDNVKDNLETAKLRLKIAERDMDLASIFTIDSFCQKMLFQYAFDSGMRFDIDLQPDESELLARLSEETWRELFYSQNKSYTEIAKHFLKTPQNALRQVKSFLTGDLPLLSDSQKEFADIKTFLSKRQKSMNEIKQFWKENSEQMTSLILADFYLNEKNEFRTKTLNGVSYKKKSLENIEIPSLNYWAMSESYLFPKSWKEKDKTGIYNIDKKFWIKFTQSYINEKTNKKNQPISSPIFKVADELFLKLKALFHSEKHIGECLTFHFLIRLREKLQAYKQSHKEKSFNDITDFMHKSLMSENGERFAQSIRHQFRFAMIDEFQDTNLAQYEIFQRIFMQNVENQGFVMIGDPKQSIYKFRGADIFSYLAAAKKVGEKNTYGMDKNWRSAPQIVSDINNLFKFENKEKSPFIYDGIQFQDVGADAKNDVLQGGNLTNCYLMPKYHKEQAAEYCAYQIQQQLKQAEQGTLFLQKNGEKRPLATKDIAILVRRRSEADAIKNALAKRKIRSIYLSARESVFESQEAQEIGRILQACLNPSQANTLLAAIGSSLWGLDASSIFQLKQNESEWDVYVEQFHQYHRIWQQQGVLPMLHRIFLEQGIIQRLTSQENAERRITDLLHLAELLQEAMQIHQSDVALLQWYQLQLRSPNGQADEQKLRLESEQELIKIVTIHGSKGLEYPVVWLPFIAEPSKPFSEVGYFGKKNTPTTYRNENNELYWAFSPISAQEQELLTREEFAEDLRLLYVALTRAKHQLNFILPETFDKQWNAVYYLLSNAAIGLENMALDESTTSYLKAKELACKAIASQEIPNDDWQVQQSEATQIQAAKFNGKIRLSGQITSFTALQKQHEYKNWQNHPQNQPLATHDEARDYDHMPYALPDENDRENNENRYSPHLFPRGNHVGNALHKVLEEWDFAQPISDEDILTKICEPLNLSKQTGNHTEWLEPLRNWLDKIINTTFADNISLKMVQKNKRFNEWEFYLRLGNKDALPQLNRLLKAESRLAPTLPDLQLNQLEGFVRGFIDMVAEINGKFYIIDYKSTYLGKSDNDYQAQQLEHAMGQSRFDLQYLLYTLALHRYLHSRLGDQYQYENHFGGVAYLFLRGMNGETNNGVFFDKPSKILIEAMDNLFC